jgi:hypothetical protein
MLLKIFYISFILMFLIGCAPTFTVYLYPKDVISGIGETVKIISTDTIKTADGRYMKVVKYQEMKRKY